MFYMKCGHYALHLYIKLAAMQNWCARIHFVPMTASTMRSVCCTRKCAGLIR